MEYETARAFADTWGLVFLVAVFLGMLVFVFRRGSGKAYRKAARIPMEASETGAKPSAAPESPAESDQRINDLKTTDATRPADREGQS